MSRETPIDSPLEFEALLSAAARDILGHEDPQRFQSWLRDHLPDFVTPEGRGMFNPDACRALATVLGIGIWNSTPLPGNGFRPRPLPRPGRNDRCPCGSGRKFKQCCGTAPEFPSIQPDVMWDFVLDALPRERLAQAVAEGKVPVVSLARRAHQLIEEDSPARAVALLEPIFAGPLGGAGSEDHEFALDMLMNAYDELGHVHKKQAVIERVIAEAPRSPLRAGAWERLASIRMDSHDSAGAWEAFDHARRDDPDSSALAHLEILLLTADGRMDEAPERARFWVKRLRRQGYDEDEELIQWLRQVVEDPEGALTDLGIMDAAGEGGALLGWLGEVAARPLPRYGVRDEPPEPEAPEDAQASLRSHLRGMGVPAGQIEAMLEELEQAAPDEGDPDEDEEPDAPGAPAESVFLDAPPALRETEHDWHEVFPLQKPFSVNEQPLEEVDAWQEEQQWGEFLARHPEAFDSIDILDDLATAVFDHPAVGSPGFERRMLLPLLERAAAIVEGALAGRSDARLAWVFSENRPALRSLARLAMSRLRSGDDAQALTEIERLLSLNPDDNHGLRSLLIDEYLHAGRDEDALALAARYPDDVHAEIAYGRVLALFRLQRRDEAREALAEAVGALPKVPRYLVEKRVRKPKLPGDGGFILGGDDQAWYYRESMRAVWEATPGALDWLKQAAPARKRAAHKTRRRRPRR